LSAPIVRVPAVFVCIESGVQLAAACDGASDAAADSDAAPEVRAMAELKLAELRPSAVMWSKSAVKSEEDRAHWLSIAADFGQWIDKRQLPSLTRALVAPPGDPF